MGSVYSAIMQASIISQAVLVLLLIMSIASWAFMLGKWYCLRAALKQAQESVDCFDSADDLSAALNRVSNVSSGPIHSITNRGIREFNRISQIDNACNLVDNNVRRALRIGVAEGMGTLSSSVSWLATTSNTAPFIGLFGTVWGIMNSFHSIAEMKSVSLATVAPGISEALIATAVGLFVAIPATMGYNMFRTKLKIIEGVCVNYAGLLLNRFEHEFASAHGMNHLQRNAKNRVMESADV